MSRLETGNNNVNCAKVTCRQYLTKPLMLKKPKLQQLIADPEAWDGNISEDSENNEMGPEIEAMLPIAPPALTALYLVLTTECSTGPGR